MGRQSAQRQIARRSVTAKQSALRSLKKEADAEPLLKIGMRLKHARLVLGLSLIKLGELTGLTEGYLSKLENNRSQASMATLNRLVATLGINMSELFSTSVDDDKPVAVVRAGHRVKLVTEHRRAGNQVTLERLVPGAPGQLLQINIHVVAPGGASLEPISHHGQEFGYLLSGAVELFVDNHSVHLAEGDGFYFDSSLPHFYRNDGNAEARILWVKTPPTF